jgi:hypothetical protein
LHNITPAFSFSKLIYKTPRFYVVFSIKLYMKMRLLVLTTLFIFLGNQLFAQSLERKHYNFARSANTSTADIAARSSGTSGTGANIDVIYHNIFWRINPDSVKYIRGIVKTSFKTTVANVSTITFDLTSVLLVDSVRFRSAKLPAANVTRSGNILSIALGATLAINFVDSVAIYYRGVPPGAVAGTIQGYQKTTGTTAGNIINTLSESYEDKDWWPCKHDMQDKIDSMDIAVSVPWGNPTVADTFWVASNGKLIDSTITGNSRTFKFKTLYPIASYLVCVSVAKYDRIYRTVDVNGTTVQVVYNLLRGKTATNKNNAIAAFDKINPVLPAFSNKIGDYPFKLEKHGFYDGLVGAGGMEHQTFSGIQTGSLTSVATLTHELMHQWFGDNVTFSTWNDLWLAEGFARYSEALAGELVPSTGLNPFTERSSMKTGALGNTTESTWIPDASAANSTGIWGGGYGGTVYERGAMVVSMLRILSGDTKFFAALTKYQTELAGKSATTDTLKNYFNRELGKDISVFFTDYVGGSGKGATAIGGIGNPTNNINWNAPTSYGQSGKRLVVTVASQTKTAGSNVSYFRGPIQLHVKGALAANDTTITFFDWGAGNLSYAGNGLSLPIAGNKLTYDLSFVPTTVAYDDSARTMSNGTTTPDITLEGYVWLGTTNTVWGTTTNWAGGIVPPSGGDVTIATTAANNPLLPTGTTVVGPLSILAGKILYLNNNTLTINNSVRYTGLISGSATSNIIVADQAATLNFDQTSSATRSLFTLTLNPKASATIGTGLLEIYGGLNLPTSTSLNVKSANLLIR